MSDFLTRLAARQLGQIASVEARVPELYATSAAATPPTIIEDMPAAVIDNRESSAVLTGAVSPTSRQNLDPALPERRRVEAPTTKYEAPSSVMKALEVPVASPPASEKRPMESSTLVPPAPLAPSKPTMSSPQQAKSEPRYLSTVGAEAPPTRTLLSAEEASTRVLATRVLSHAAPPRLEIKDFGGNQSAEPHDEPAVSSTPVQVTIGCIEVTTLSAPAERRASKPRKASMSLDNYLAARQRGRRE
jgi:hypothetical protein